MREQLDALPIVMDQPGMTVRSPGAWGGFTLLYTEYKERTDGRPLLEGLPNDMCPCPHWGYVVEHVAKKMQS